MLFWKWNVSRKVREARNMSFVFLATLKSGMYFTNYWNVVLLHDLGIYKQTTMYKKLSLDKDYIAKSALPFLLPLAVEPGLNITQVK